jgi:hypothetical protein
MLRIAAVIAAIILAIAGAAELYKVAAEPPGPMKPEDFARAVRQVTALARETAFLCARIEDDSVTGPFASTHREKLEEELRDQVEALAGPVPPALADAASQARALAADLGKSLGELKLHLAEPAMLAKVRGDAGRVAAAIAPLEPR